MFLFLTNLKKKYYSLVWIELIKNYFQAINLFRFWFLWASHSGFMIYQIIMHALSLCFRHSQNEITPFIRLNCDWMVAEWRLNDDKWWQEKWFSVTFQSPSSDHSVDWMAGTFHRLFSQFIFWKKNFARCGSNPEYKNQGESTLSIRLWGPLIGWKFGICIDYV